MANIQGIDKISDSLGYLVLTEEGAVLSSGGDLQNAESLANQITKIVYTASKIPVCAEKRDNTGKKISVVWDNFLYIMTVSNRKIYVTKRQYNPQEPAVA